MDASVSSALVTYGLPIAAAVAFVSALAIPTGLPPIVVLLLTGAICLKTPSELVGAIALLTVAEASGAATLFTISRAGRSRILARLPRAVAADAARRLAATRTRLQGRDAIAVAALRLVPGVRHLVSVAAGTLGVGRRDFALGTVVSSWLWTTLFLSIGFRFRHDASELRRLTDGLSGWLQPVLLIAFAVAAIILFVRWRVPMRRAGH